MISRRLPPVAVLASLLALGACTDRQPTTPTVEGLVIREVILVGDDGSITFSHQDHWHGAPVVRAGGSVRITKHFTDWRASADDHDAPPVEKWFTLDTRPAEYDTRVVVETPIAQWSGDRVRGTLSGTEEGASRLSIVVQRAGATLYEAPPLNFRVTRAIAGRAARERE